MEIGKKLREAKAGAKLTQEQVAERLFVSRQTISNWENERTYPDIISVVKLSDLYSISLDELLKGDTKMLEHLEESTDLVKSNKKLILAVAANIIVVSICTVAAVLRPEDMSVVIWIFCLSIVSIAGLLYQIVKRI